MRKKRWIFMVVAALVVVFASVFAGIFTGLCMGGNKGAADELFMFPSAGGAQNLSVLIKTEHGRLIVIDGGWEEDAACLVEQIKQQGGTVAAWFLTHPHEDHGGALAKILEDGGEGINIEKIYGSFADPQWYETYAPEDPGITKRLLAAFQTLPQGTVETQIGKGDVFQIDDVSVEVMNDRGQWQEDAVNNSCVTYKFQIKGQRILFLGDLGYLGGEALLRDRGADDLRAEIVQMAHHGQGGVGKEVYEAISPQICLWPTPEWLWDDDGGDGPGSGPWSTLETRAWMKDLGVKEHKCTKDGIIHMYFQ